MPRYLRIVETVMGIPVSIEADATSDVIGQAFAALHKVDAQFSMYLPASELCQYRAGTLTDEQVSPEMREVMRSCEKLQAQTEGYFSAYYSGNFDPTGYVKGWAIARAAKVLHTANVVCYSINAGGDVMMASNGEKLWRVGIQDPRDSRRILGRVSIKSGAIATSGNYVRGAHIYDPKRGVVVDDGSSVSIIGPDIVLADVYATACIAMGNDKAIRFIAQQPDYEALFVQANGELMATAGFMKNFSTQIVR